MWVEKVGKALDDIPHILCGVAELAAGDTGGEGVIADGDLLVHEFIRKIVRTFGHGSNKDTNTLVLVEGLHVFSYTDNFRLET